MTQTMKQLVFAEPFDLLFKNFFDNEEFFQPAFDKKPKYPVNIFESQDPENAGLHIDIAVVGLTDDDIDIEIKDGDTITVNYDKPSNEDPDPEEFHNWIHRGIAQRSFSLGWKIGNKFELDNTTADVENGLLNIFIPLSESKKPKKIQLGRIKSKKQNKK